jgi:2'-5' RNA ligase
VQIREDISKSLQRALAQAEKAAAKPATEISAYSFPNLYDEMDIDKDKFGCIMLDVTKIPVMDYAQATEDDLFTSNDAESYMQGAVAEHTPHVTVLYGLMESGQAWRKWVNIVLKGWHPETVTVDKVGYFDIPGKDNYCVIAHIQVTKQLKEGNGRLRILPHVDTFMEYKPHVTLGYIKKDKEILDRWVENLGTKLNGKKLTVQGINYGD